MTRVTAIDLGATSGRVSVVEIGDDKLSVQCVHRFPNRPVQLGDRLVWDIIGLYAEIEAGLAKVAASGPTDSIGVDSWGCDYALVTPSGDLCGLPVCYRDPRTLVPGDDGRTAVDRVHDIMPPAALYAATGTQYEPLNTVYQLASDTRLHRDDTFLMIPDLVTFWLTGVRSGEVTNASTTGMLDLATRRRLDAVTPDLVYPELRSPGTLIGRLTGPAGQRTGLAGTPVIAVGTHDTASAFAAVPSEDGRQAAIISSGTWSLVGLRLDQPIATEASRAANFSNEIGVDGTYRFLRNVMGRWVLDQCVRAWGTSVEDVLAAAAQEPGGVTFDIDDVTLLAAGDDMPSRVEALIGRPLGQAATARAVLDSLAVRYNEVIAKAGQLTGRAADVVHIVGGGARDALLCQLTADATGLTVIAGPVEATTIGNALLQSPVGATPRGRDLVRRTQPLVEYTPRR